jgi:hypothetical protein
MNLHQVTTAHYTLYEPPKQPGIYITAFSQQQMNCCDVKSHTTKVTYKQLAKYRQAFPRYLLTKIKKRHRYMPVIISVCYDRSIVKQVDVKV